MEPHAKIRPVEREQEDMRLDDLALWQMGYTQREITAMRRDERERERKGAPLCLPM